MNILKHIYANNTLKHQRKLDWVALMMTDHHSLWHLVVPWCQQVSRDQGIGKAGSMNFAASNYLRVSAKFVRFMPILDIWMWKLETTLNIISAYPVNEVTMLIVFQWLKQLCHNLKRVLIWAFSFPLTWWSYIVPSPSLPLKPNLILCHPLFLRQAPPLCQKKK